MLSRYLLLILILLFGNVPGVFANQDELLHRYQSLQKDYRFADKLTLQSSTTDNRLAADVYSHVEFSFTQVRTLLQQPNMWCEFLTLHLNIKSCIVARQQDKTYIVVFAGRKYYEKPLETEHLKYRFQLVQETNTFLSVELSAEDGPFGTSDYIIRLQATPLEAGTVLHVHTAYTSSTFSRIGSSVYLGTRGRNKVGFSISGYDELHQPIYVGGVKGIIERNAMRYFLAFEAMFQTWSVPQAKRLDARIKRWFELTQVYKQQLSEMEWAEYRDAKRKEYNNQRHLQELLDKGVSIEDILYNNE